MESVSLDDLTIRFDSGGKSDVFDAALAKYSQFGCFLAKGILNASDLEPIRYYISRLIELRYKFGEIEPALDEDGQSRFDDGFIGLNKIDRKHGAVIFDGCRRLLPLHELSVDARLVSLAKALIKSDVIIASDVKAVRVDQPNEDKYLFDWHQDYPYVMDSVDAVVFWIPLHDVDETNGCLRIALGSNKFGLQKLILHDPQNKMDNKQKFMELADKSVVNKVPQLSVPASYGDALVFNTLLMHCSQPNISTRARWTAQVRFGNFAHELAVKRNWPGSLRDGTWFHERHPEYIVSNSSATSSGTPVVA